MSKTDLVPDPKDASLLHIRKLGLLPGIRSKKDYALAVELGSIEARGVYDSQKCLTEPSIEKVAGNHQIIFRKIHPWAGQFREPGVGVKFGDHEGAVSNRIEAELKLLFKQTDWILRHEVIDPDSGRDITGYVAIAHFHGKFERIHPFRDGNGRTGRSLLYSQMRELGAPDMVISERVDYMSRIRNADRGILKPLVNLMLGAGREVDMDLPSPFRMSPIAWSHPMAHDDPQEEFDNSFLR